MPPRMMRTTPKVPNAASTESLGRGVDDNGVVGHDCDSVVLHGEETTVSRNMDSSAFSGLDFHSAGGQQSDHGGVTRQHADITIRREGIHAARRPGPHKVIRGDDLDVQLGHDYFVAFWMSAH